MYSDDLFETVNFRYGQVTFFANDTGAITDSLRLYGEWAENELSFMLSMVREGDTVIDVGAYIGTHALAFARHVGESGRVVSIEAQSTSFEVLSRNIAANGVKHVRLEHAVASATAKDELIPSIDIESPASYGSASLRDVLVPGVHTNGHEGASGRPEGLAIRSIAVDDLDVSSCALIKIDVEGMEDMVLRGAGRTIGRCQPAIYAECNSLEDGLRSLALLKEYGYRVRAHVVLAYNADNFRENPENIFGGAREVALVGTLAAGPDPLEAYVLRSCELLVDVETADDLALALLNKPQYEHEVLRNGAAGRSGGRKCLDEVRELRAGYEEANQRVEALRRDFDQQLAHALDGARIEADQRLAAAEEEKNRLLAGMQAQVEQLRAELGDMRAQIEPALAKLASASADAVQTRAREAALQTALDEIHGSTSWRLTAPLRRLKRVTKGS
ncbi:MAG: FkbM family methyltransferase [Paraburkholderia sp.]|uniref:FkbM family methyltransferase n=1 Tax=Paraburkholderia sp. TaxID=1926495 RepID=UPI003C3CDBF0